MALSSPVMASISSLEYSKVPNDKIVEHAFDIIDDYGFTLKEKAALFGLNPVMIKSLDELLDHVHTFLEYGNIDVWNRIAFLISIRNQLDARFGPDNLDAHLKCLSAPPGMYSDMSLRDLMNTGHYMDLQYVTYILGTPVPFTSLI